MQELISPAQSEKLVLIGALLLALWGAIAAYRAVGSRGLVGAIPGALVYPLWQLHKYVTRFEPGIGSQPSYFGLDKVKVLLGEVVLFVVLGAALGWMWSKFQLTTKDTKNAETVDERPLSAD